MKIVALANQKGGVGKTTTAINLGAYLAHRNKRVLILDLDPQANATSGLGVEPGVNESIYQALLGESAVSGLPIRTQYANLSIIPSQMDLAGVEIDLAAADDRLIRLRNVLHQFRSEGAPYDFLLIDCPPSLGILMTGALAAADEVLIPLQCEYFGLEGLSKIVKVLTDVGASGANPGVIMEGIVMTMADSRTNLTELVINDVRTHFQTTVYETVIPRSIRLAEAPSFNQSILDYDPKSRGALAYESLCDEFLRRHASV